MVTSEKHQAKNILEHIHQVLGNLVKMYNLQESYIDEQYQCKVILLTVKFEISYRYHITKVKILVLRGFGWDMIIPIKNIVNWKLLSQKQHAKRGNKPQTDQKYSVRNKVILKNNMATIYKLLLKGHTL